MERLIAYAYWPWEQPYPKFRKADATPKKAMLISSSAAPSWFGRWLYRTSKQLDMTAKTIGAQPVGTLFTGLANTEKHKRLPPNTAERARLLAAKLI